MIIKDKNKIKNICVLLSSYEGSGSDFEKYDEYQDPSRYVTNYNFVLKYIKKETAIEQLKKIHEENFDLYINFMWGQDDDKVSGIEAVKYIESLNVPIIGTNSNFLSMSKLDFKKKAEEYKILTPNYYLFEKDNKLNKLDSIKLKFPLIIKPTRGCGSLHMTEKSICYNIYELKEQIEILSEKINCDILIEEFIIGKEISIMVIEDNYDIIAMKPIVYEFPKNMPEMKQFLYFENKFDAIDNKEITYKLYDENEELMEKIKEIGCKSYESLDVTGSGYARIDMRINDKNNIFVLEVNPTPAFFCQLNNKFGDDYVIQKCFKNSHNELMDYIINTKLYQINCCEIGNTYNDFSEKYDESFNESNYPYLLENISKKYKFEGDILDLGCGTGMFGRNILKYNQNINLIGIDISSEMIKKAKEYNKLFIGPIQKMLSNINNVDHIISNGALHFLDNKYFEKTLLKLFEITSISITIGIEDIPDIYNEKLISMGYKNMYSYNNINIIEKIKIPNWKIVYKERSFMWKSPKTNDNIHGIFYRFEKDIISDLNIRNKN